MLLLFIVCISFASCFADEGERAYVLFEKADSNNDSMLNRQELDDIFLLFDINNDTEISPDEFVKDWTSVYDIGAPSEAQTLFTRADNNDDGYIDSKDIPAIFYYFDMNGNGLVDINEFLSRWGDLVLTSNNSVDVSVDITG